MNVNKKDVIVNLINFVEYAFENPSIDKAHLRIFGLKHLKLVINSIGDSESRKEYNEALVNHFEPVIAFCSDCQSRLHTNRCVF